MLQSKKTYAEQSYLIQEGECLRRYDYVDVRPQRC